MISQINIGIICIFAVDITETGRALPESSRNDHMEWLSIPPDRCIDLSVRRILWENRVPQKIEWTKRCCREWRAEWRHWCEWDSCSVETSPSHPPPRSITHPHSLLIVLPVPSPSWSLARIRRAVALFNASFIVEPATVWCGCNAHTAPPCGQFFPPELWIATTKGNDNSLTMQ